MTSNQQDDLVNAVQSLQRSIDILCGILRPSLEGPDGPLEIHEADYGWIERREAIFNTLLEQGLSWDEAEGKADRLADEYGETEED